MGALLRTGLLSAAVMLSACETLQSETRHCAAADRMVETQLFFGLVTKHGEVTAAEWKDFLARDVVPRFAEGFTVLDAQGFWLNGQLKKTISEKSKVILRIHPEGTPHDQAIVEIIDAYKKRFAQESVLRVDRAVCAQF
jgi:hypothetical protein